MSGTWGNKIKLSIFGESHGVGIGIVIDGLEPGLKIDMDYIKNQMKRRAPGLNKFSTSRKEADEFEIMSGIFNGKTTGTPLCAVIYNKNTHSKDYEKTKNLMRPGHADYTGYVKYRGFNDYRGGGHFSGRLTAPIVFAGAICKKVLEDKNIVIGSHIKSIGNVEDYSFSLHNGRKNSVLVTKELLNKLNYDEFPVLNNGAEQKMKNTILKVKEEGDSAGGIIEVSALNLPAGVGNPFFDSIESTLSHLLFSIPAVKGVEFGAGFDITRMMGSEANDEYYINEDKVINTYSNNNGGILGGISDGMPLIFRTAIKPTPSIAKMQKTVNIEKNENEILKIQGRHDPCIVLRALPVIESAAAIAIMDLL
ncbi:chorismate synthase [Clostridium sp. JN-1]|uniref:chorismate synthase n=1 Tax=Clostridium sp. JN-1 TaxID=2483110 RepID=UPI000F0B8E64|nr:chorismate synthase [Clostridium sp. JN-1]